MDVKKFIALVAKVINEYEVVINKGSEDGVFKGDKFVIYETTDEIIKDPETNEEIGKYEIFKGEGRVTNVLEKTSYLESTNEKIITKKLTPTNSIGISNIMYLPHSYFNSETEETEEIKKLPFKKMPKVRDKVKRL